MCVCKVGRVVCVQEWQQAWEQSRWDEQQVALNHLPSWTSGR